jgi:hypothetical protein
MSRHRRQQRKRARGARAADAAWARLVARTRRQFASIDPAAPGSDVTIYGDITLIDHVQKIAADRRARTSLEMGRSRDAYVIPLPVPISRGRH